MLDQQKLKLMKSNDFFLTLQAPIPQNGQTHSNNSSAKLSKRNTWEGGVNEDFGRKHPTKFSEIQEC